MADRIERYDRRGKILQVTSGIGLGAAAESIMEYGPLGSLTYSEDFDPRREPESGSQRIIAIYTGDDTGYTGHGTGNLYSQATAPITAMMTRRYVYERGTGRQRGYLQEGVMRTDATFDAAGNREYAAWPAGEAAFRARSLYSADNRLAMTDRISCVKEAPDVLGCYSPHELIDDNSGVVERYRYDALGRRVVVRAMRDGRCTNPGLCHSTIERTIWDGDQILYEIRMPGDFLSSTQLERDTTTIVEAANAPYGRVAYTYGLQLDAPLSIIRMGYTFSRTEMDRVNHDPFFLDFYGAMAIFPHQNWRGAYDIGTFADGLDEG